MATKQITPQFVYGMGDNLIQVAPRPIIANRAPTTRDQAELGSTWVDTSAGVFYGLASITANSSNWTTTPAAGATVLASLDITGAGTSLDVQNAAGTTVISSGTINFDNAAGTTTISGALTVSGVTTLTGDLDLSSGALIDLTSTLDAAPSIYLHANGGTSEQIRIRSDQGTGVSSILIDSDVGGLTLQSGLASDDAININSTAGGIDIDAALQVNLASSEAASDAILITASNAAGGIDMIAGTAGLDVLATGGDIVMACDGFDFDCSANGFDVLATAGAFSIDGALASNITTTGAGIDLTLSSVLGSVLVSSTEDAALAIKLHANGGVSETIQLHSDQGTGVDSINLLSDVGGITLTATGMASEDAINFVATAGGIDMDAALQVNIASSEAADDAIVINASNAAGGIDITSGGGDIDISGGDITISGPNNTAETILITTNNGTSETMVIEANQGTGKDAIDISSAGGVEVTTGALAATTGLHLVQSAQTAAIQVGTGAPSHNAPKGSLYLRTDGSSTSTRGYIATDAVGTWTAITTAA